MPKFDAAATAMLRTKLTATAPSECSFCGAQVYTAHSALCSLCIAAELAVLDADQLRNVVDSSRDILLDQVQ